MSEQALVDCSWGYDNYGCDGGLSSNAYKWIMDNNCIPTEDTYGQYLMQVSGWGSVHISCSCYKVAFCPCGATPEVYWIIS